MNKTNTIAQRIKDFRALCAANRISYKEVAERSGENYDSLRSNMRINGISDERMSKLEDAALELRDEKNLQTSNS